MLCWVLMGLDVSGYFQLLRDKVSQRLRSVMAGSDGLGFGGIRSGMVFSGQFLQGESEITVR